MVVFTLLILVSNAVAEELTIVGTGSGPSILKAIGKAFTTQHPDITVNVPRSIGSGGGIKAVGNDEYHVARIARYLKDTEQHYNLSYRPVCNMPVVFFTHPGVEIKNLTHQQVLDIYSGKIYNWKVVGGHDARIRVIKRQEGDSSLRILKNSFPHFKDITITSLAKTTYSDPETLELAEKTANTIAFCTYADVIKYELNVITLDGVSPTDASYPYYAPFGLVYKEKNNAGAIKQFLEFVESPVAVKAITQSGGVPLVEQ